MQNLAQNQSPCTGEPIPNLRTAAGSSLRLHVGGQSKILADLQCTLAEAAGLLTILGGVEATRNLEARLRTQDRLGAALLEVFRVTVGLREVFDALERMAAADAPVERRDARASNEAVRALDSVSGELLVLETMLIVDQLDDDDRAYLREQIGDARRRIMSAVQDIHDASVGDRCATGEGVDFL